MDIEKLSIVLLARLRTQAGAPLSFQPLEPFFVGNDFFYDRGMGYVRASAYVGGVERPCKVPAVPVTPAQFMAINGREVANVGFVSQEEIDETAKHFPHLFPSPPAPST